MVFEVQWKGEHPVRGTGNGCIQYVELWEGCGDDVGSFPRKRRSLRGHAILAGPGFSLAP